MIAVCIVVTIGLVMAAVFPFVLTQDSQRDRTNRKNESNPS